MGCQRLIRLLNAWFLGLMIHAAAIAAASAAAQPVKLHNLLPQTRMRLAAGECASWQIDNQLAEIFQLKVVSTGESACPEQTLRCGLLTPRHLARPGRGRHAACKVHLRMACWNQPSA